MQQLFIFQKWATVMIWKKNTQQVIQRFVGVTWLLYLENPSDSS